MAVQGVGVIYVATSASHYVEQAAISAASLREVMPQIPVTLCTDLGPHQAFDHVVPVGPGGGKRQKVEPCMAMRISLATALSRQRSTPICSLSRIGSTWRGSSSSPRCHP